MTLRTALVIDGDSAAAQKAVADLERGMERAGDEAVQMGRKAGASASEVAREAQRAAAGVGRLGAANRLSGHHASNLAFQLQDVVVALQMGQNPMQVALQQGGQIGQIMMQAGIGAGGLAKEVARMTGRFIVAHPVLLGIAAATGIAAAGLGVLTSQVNQERQAEIEAFASSLGLSKEEIEELGGAAVTSGDMLGGLWDVIVEGLGLDHVFSDIKGWMVEAFTEGALYAKKNLSEIYAAGAATVDSFGHVWKNIGPIIGDAVTAGANIAIGALEWLINKAIDGINTLQARASPILALANMAGLDTTLGHVELGRLENQYAGAGAAAADVFASAYQRRLGEAQGAFDDFMERWEDAAVERAKGRLQSGVEEKEDKPDRKRGSRAKAEKLSEEEKAYRKAMDAARGYSEQLAEETARIGLNAIELKEREASLAAAAAREAAMKAPTAAQARALIDQSVAIMGNLQAWKERTLAQQATDYEANVLEPIRREAQVLGLVGWARQSALLQMEREVQLRPLMTQLAQAEAAGQKEIADQIRRQIDLINEKFGLQIQVGNEEERLDREAEAARRLRDEYMHLGQAGVGALSDIVLRGENAADVMKRLALSIADAALEALLLGSGPLAGVFGASGGGGLVASIFGSIFGGKRATGGPVAPGQIYAVNERSTAPGLFLPLGPGRIDPPVNDNAAVGGAGVVEVRLHLGDNFEAEVVRISSNVSVNTFREAAPVLLEGAVSETARRLSRPRM